MIKVGLLSKSVHSGLGLPWSSMDSTIKLWKVSVYKGKDCIRHHKLEISDSLRAVLLYSTSEDHVTKLLTQQNETVCCSSFHQCTVTGLWGERRERLE